MEDGGALGDEEGSDQDGTGEGGGQAAELMGGSGWHATASHMCG